MYQNPYGSDQQETDPAAVRRKAILDLMDGPSRTTQGPPSTPYTPPVATTYPGAQTASSPSPRDTASGSDMPDLPDAANPYGGTPAPTTPPATTYQNPDNGLQYGSQILDLYSKPYERRGGGTGGIGSGALTGASIGSVAGPIGAGAGAVIGGIVGAARKHAESAPTDFTVQDATAIIQNSYRDMFGRAATPDEVQAALTGQGWKQGDRYVGQQGLQGVLGHLAENAAAGRATASGATAAATSDATAGATGAGGSGATAAGTAAASPAAGGGGGNMGYLEGFEKDKFDDPNKHDTKYDFAHLVGGLPPTPATLDAQWDAIVKQFPNAKRTGTGSIDFGDGGGSIDVIRAAGEGGKAWHFEPESGATSATTTAAPASAGIGGLPTSAAATAGLAAPLTNNTVLQQIMEEVQRIQRGEAPRNAILSQMGLA